jgi:hypothetical protein
MKYLRNLGHTYVGMFLGGSAVLWQALVYPKGLHWYTTITYLFLALGVAALFWIIRGFMRARKAHKARKTAGYKELIDTLEDLQER